MTQFYPLTRHSFHRRFVRIRHKIGNSYPPDVVAFPADARFDSDRCRERETDIKMKMRGDRSVNRNRMDVQIKNLPGKIGLVDITKTGERTLATWFRNQICYTGFFIGFSFCDHKQISTSIGMTSQLYPDSQFSVMRQ